MDARVHTEAEAQQEKMLTTTIMEVAEESQQRSRDTKFFPFHLGD